MSSNQELEQQITALGLTAPRITPDQIDAMVEALSYHTYVIPGTTTTVASAIDRHNFVVAIDSASSVSAANFNEALGRNAAISKVKAAAKKELWKLEGYRLSKNLNQAAKVGLIAGLEIYADENLRDDLMFVGDVATGFCVVAIDGCDSKADQPAP